MTTAIRQAVPADAPRLAAFAGEQFREAYGLTHPEPILSDYLASSFSAAEIARRLADPERIYLLTEGGASRLVGYVELHAGGPVAPTTRLERALPGRTPLEIVRFYVDRSAHGQGIAQGLMEACHAAARTRRCDLLWLQAWQQAARALRFYKKAGFTVHGTAIFQFGERADHDFVLARQVVHVQDGLAHGK